MELNKTPQKNALIIYHREDNDGVFSATIMQRFLENHPEHAKTYCIAKMGASYPELSAMVKSGEMDETLSHYDLLIMVDISFNELSYMKKLVKRFGDQFIWIDHHRPIIDAIRKEKIEINGIQEYTPGKSALWLTFQYCYDPMRVHEDEYPVLLKILSKYDSWGFDEEYPKSLCVPVNTAITDFTCLDTTRAMDIICNLYDIHYVENTGLNSIGDRWEIRVNYNYDNQIIADAENFGSNIIKHNKFLWRELMHNCAERNWTVGPNNDRSIMLVYNGPTSSQIFESVADLDFKHGIIFKKNPNNTWTISMYNVKTDYDKEFHCGNYLKKVFKKGGGHAGAAGCTISNSKAIELFRKRHF